jgi:outer membrane receptor protein involved in Fe transport
MFRQKPLVNAISCAIAASAFGLSPLVLAQDVVVEEAGEDQAIETVLVTGSRIKKDVFSHSTPIDVIDAEVSSLQGIADVGALLQSTTVAAGSSQVTAATSTAFVQNGGVGAQTLSWRGLGANRTLTLLNGRRVGPAGTQGGVSAFDLNVLPLIAIDRVEVLKDGASSIYGSDAVAGVVNIITKKGDGGSLDAYLGVPMESGGMETRVSGSWGKSFERGSFRITGDYHRIDELKMGDRDYLACGEYYIFDPDTGERADPIDPRTGKPACFERPWGHVWIYDYQDEGGNVPAGAKAQFDYDGDLGNYIPGFADNDPNDPTIMRTPPGWFPVAYDRASDGVYNNDHPFQDETSFSPKTERATLFADGEYELTDNMELYAEALLNRRETTVNGYRQFWGYIYNHDWTYWYGFDFGNPLNEGWTGAQWYSPTAITDHNDTFIQVDYQRFAVGLRGDIGDDWNWDLSYQYSNSDGSYTNDVIYGDSIWDQDWLYEYDPDYSPDDFDVPGGSCVGMVTSERGVPCQDIPWLDPYFLAGEIDPGMREFLFGRETGNTEYTQWSLEGYVAGEWFEMPAGTMGVALGFHYREDEIRDVPGESAQSGNAWGDSEAGITAGKDTTQAVFAEVDVPILAGKPGFEYLALNASGRYTDVDSYGSDTTYKVGLNWQITPTVRFRANQGTSFRTPALFELYLAAETGFLQQRFIDPCINWGTAVDAGDISQRVADNCAATIVPVTYPDGLPPDYTGGTVTATIFSSGGLGELEAETSTSKTAGIVWQPEFADLSISLDYFDIEVENQVDRIGAGGIVGACYASEFWPDDPLCDLFDRTGLNGGTENIIDNYINIATQTSSGWDLALQWVTELGPGTLKVDTQHTFQDEASTAFFEGFERDENGEFGEPEWVGRLWLTYDWSDWSFFWGADFIGEVSNTDDFGGDTTTYRGEEVRVVLDSDAVTYHSLSATRFFPDWGLNVTAGLRNAFDEEPPKVTTLNLGQIDPAGYSVLESQYDYFGRRIFVNLTWDFE